MRPRIELRLFDTHIGIWQDSAADASFREEVYGGLIRLMRARGWTIGQDPHVRRQYVSLSPNHRIGRKGALRCSIEISGRMVKIEVWAETWTATNHNGHRYDFVKLMRFTYLDRLRFVLERRHIIAWLSTIAPVTGAEPGDDPASPMEIIARRYRESWHTDKATGIPVCTCESNRRSADGQLIEHGQTVWIRDRSGRWIRGTAFYNINNMWWVVAGGALFNEHCGALHIILPAAPRQKVNVRIRRERLEAELQRATAARQWRRAELLDAILFNGAEVFQIWSRKNDAWYRTGCAGYTNDRSKAGCYTRAEAEAEVRRVPHNLEAHGPNGEVIRFTVAA